MSYKVKINDDNVNDFDFEIYDDGTIGELKNHPPVFTIEQFSEALVLARHVSEYIRKFSQKGFKVELKV